MVSPGVLIAQQPQLERYWAEKKGAPILSDKAQQIEKEAGTFKSYIPTGVGHNAIIGVPTSGTVDSVSLSKEQQSMVEKGTLPASAYVTTPTSAGSTQTWTVGDVQAYQTKYGTSPYMQPTTQKAGTSQQQLFSATSKFTGTYEPMQYSQSISPVPITKEGTGIPSILAARQKTFQPIKENVFSIAYSGVTKSFREGIVMKETILPSLEYLKKGGTFALTKLEEVNPEATKKITPIAKGTYSFVSETATDPLTYLTLPLLGGAGFKAGSALLRGGVKFLESKGLPVIAKGVNVAYGVGTVGLGVYGGYQSVTAFRAAPTVEEKTKVVLGVGRDVLTFGIGYKVGSKVLQAGERIAFATGGKYVTPTEVFDPKSLAYMGEKIPDIILTKKELFTGSPKFPTARTPQEAFNILKSSKSESSKISLMTATGEQFSKEATVKMGGRPTSSGKLTEDPGLYLSAAKRTIGDITVGGGSPRFTKIGMKEPNLLDVVKEVIKTAPKNVKKESTILGKVKTGVSEVTSRISFGVPSNVKPAGITIDVERLVKAPKSLVSEVGKTGKYELVSEFQKSIVGKNVAYQTVRSTLGKTSEIEANLPMGSKLKNLGKDMFSLVFGSKKYTVIQGRVVRLPEYELISNKKVGKLGLEKGVKGVTSTKEVVSEYLSPQKYSFGKDLVSSILVSKPSKQVSSKIVERVSVSKPSGVSFPKFSYSEMNLVRSKIISGVSKPVNEVSIAKGVSGGSIPSDISVSKTSDVSKKVNVKISKFIVGGSISSRLIKPISPIVSKAVLQRQEKSGRSKVQNRVVGKLRPVADITASFRKIKIKKGKAQKKYYGGLTGLEVRPLF